MGNEAIDIKRAREKRMERYREKCGISRSPLIREDREER